MRFDAVAFDLDGTLYPTSSLYLRALPLALPNIRRLAAFNAARQTLRRLGSEDAEYRRNPPRGEEAFRLLEASLAAPAMGMRPEEALAYIAREFYEKVESLFEDLKPFRGVDKALDALAERGLRLAVLSDLPPRRKLKLLGLEGRFETALCSSASGYLKPAPEPFMMLAENLGLQPERILYVGNSPNVDARGANKVGMTSAIVSRRRIREADFSFFKWSRLVEFVLS
jgi:putative hydrolase of the HAD superfamily